MIGRVAHVPEVGAEHVIGGRLQRDGAVVLANRRLAVDLGTGDHAVVGQHHIGAGIGKHVGLPRPTRGIRMRIGGRHRALGLEVAIRDQLDAFRAGNDGGELELGLGRRQAGKAKNQGDDN